jgi:thiamine biosynthesis lipoprotein
MDTCDSIRRAQPLLGTFVEITAAGATRSGTEKAIEEAFAAVAQVHRLMSFHDLNSDVSRLNREAKLRAVTVHAWTYRVLDIALALHRGSSGMFDIAVAPLLQSLGWLPGAKDDARSISAKMNSPDAIELLPGRGVRFRHPGIAIDLGGIAKGFAVDRAVDILRSRGIMRGLVNAGGDLAAFGPRPESIHIRDPRDPRRLLFHVEISNAALASSGSICDPLQSVDIGGSAIIDPTTREPVRGVVGATIRAPSCMIADALTKIVMIAGENAAHLLQHYGASALLVLRSGGVRLSPDWHDAVRLAA